MSNIEIKGARTHNLKNLDVSLPRDNLIVITGLSGSGKSSLAFDTIYAEGQRRYVESLSAYARQFLSMMEKPEVDLIEGLSPAISIEQKTTSHNPRSTVGTVTEIYDYLRLLYARIGDPYCPNHDRKLGIQNVSEMVDQIMKLKNNNRMAMVAPLINNRKGEHVDLIKNIRSRGFIRLRINGEVHDIDELPQIDAKKNNTIEVVVDRFTIKPDIENRLSESLETTLDLSNGIAKIISLDDSSLDILFSNKFSLKYKRKLIVGAISKFDGHIFSFDFNNKSSPCLKCFYQSEPSDEVLNCESEGILGTTSNIIGSMQANEVLKNIISSDKSLHSSILVVNLKKLEFRKIKFTKKKGCLCN